MVPTRAPTVVPRRRTATPHDAARLTLSDLPILIHLPNLRPVETSPPAALVTAPAAREVVVPPADELPENTPPSVPRRQRPPLRRYVRRENLTSHSDIGTWRHWWQHGGRSTTAIAVLMLAAAILYLIRDWERSQPRPEPAVRSPLPLISKTPGTAELWPDPGLKTEGQVEVRTATHANDMDAASLVRPAPTERPGVELIPPHNSPGHEGTSHPEFPGSRAADEAGAASGFEGSQSQPASPAARVSARPAYAPEVSYDGIPAPPATGTAPAAPALPDRYPQTQSWPPAGDMPRR